MTNKELSLRQKVELIIEDKTLTDYRIAKETGLTLSSVQKLRNGTTNPDNLRLLSAEKYAIYYDKISLNKR